MGDRKTPLPETETASPRGEPVHVCVNRRDTRNVSFQVSEEGSMFVLRTSACHWPLLSGHPLGGVSTGVALSRAGAESCCLETALRGRAPSQEDAAPFGTCGDPQSNAAPRGGPVLRGFCRCPREADTRAPSAAGALPDSKAMGVPSAPQREFAEFTGSRNLCSLGESPTMKTKL